MLLDQKRQEKTDEPFGLRILEPVGRHVIKSLANALKSR